MLRSYNWARKELERNNWDCEYHDTRHMSHKSTRSWSIIVHHVWSAHGSLNAILEYHPTPCHTMPTMSPQHHSSPSSTYALCACKSILRIVMNRQALHALSSLSWTFRKTRAFNLFQVWITWIRTYLYQDLCHRSISSSSSLAHIHKFILW